MSVSINVVSAREGTHAVTCTTTGGTVLSGSLTVPGGMNIINFSTVGTRNYRGQDSYRASTGTRTGGSNGDTYQCTATNGVSSPDESGSATLKGIYCTGTYTQWISCVDTLCIFLNEQKVGCYCKKEQIQEE